MYLSVLHSRPLSCVQTTLVRCWKCPTPGAREVPILLAAKVALTGINKTTTACVVSPPPLARPWRAPARMFELRARDGALFAHASADDHQGTPFHIKCVTWRGAQSGEDDRGVRQRRHRRALGSRAWDDLMAKLAQNNFNAIRFTVNHLSILRNEAMDDFGDIDTAKNLWFAGMRYVSMLRAVAERAAAHRTVCSSSWLLDGLPRAIPWAPTANVALPVCGIASIAVATTGAGKCRSAACCKAGRRQPKDCAGSGTLWAST